jgi:hypothetical protein
MLFTTNIQLVVDTVTKTENTKTKIHESKNDVESKKWNAAYKDVDEYEMVPPIG